MVYYFHSFEFLVFYMLNFLPSLFTICFSLSISFCSFFLFQKRIKFLFSFYFDISIRQVIKLFKFTLLELFFYFQEAIKSIYTQVYYLIVPRETVK